MPSPRRLRLVMLAAIVTVVLILFYSSGLDDSKKDTRSFQDFYHKTMDGMSSNKKSSPPPPGQAVLDSKTGVRAGHIPADTDGDGDVDDDDRRASAGTKERLRQAEQKAKDLANEKSPLKPDPPSEVVGKGNSADGQVKKKPADAGSGVGKTKDAPLSKEEQEMDAELNAILKKAPVIIFSKTYCPYSKRAKGILLEKYAITPAPYVVELDEHPKGRPLQDRLKHKTGRGTVPNVLIQGVSIGGSDEIVELDNADKLVARIRGLAGKGVEVSERFSARAGHNH
ncbi:hypothetical protein JDV02_001597 [Purpureocillium takamizusanense]|uniref:Glutaredoxin domain-containing protein n=1 Tax=Purpureocillium takamizusanense TaxID=2060973 RepID=A0A9Q8Q728_9HYPO|nr:uncharacterized protein JDV02_001597 [Purpureocillium takamizusanense]UNI15024.1 hypothetical protein JDV02_001597 [Purpureocillium takamizusanense]